MPEHQQVQQSTESKSNAQKQVTTASPTQASNPYFIIQRAKINPKSLTHADIMQLQRTIGNRAVGMLLSSIRNSSTAQQATVQHQEIPEEEEPLQGKMDETVQRQEAPEEEEPLQGKMIIPVQRQEIPEPEEEEPPLQGKFENKTQQETCPSCSTLPIQRETENLTGIPDDLKAGVENLSGIDMSDVRVHYNSDKPAQVGALAYTQGTDIHVAPGQERHLPHEAWHVVQQAQGRVRPTMQLKDGVPINDDEELEQEANVMGEQANQLKQKNDQSGGGSRGGKLAIVQGSALLLQGNFPDAYNSHRREVQGIPQESVQLDHMVSQKSLIGFANTYKTLSNFTFDGSQWEHSTEAMTALREVVKKFPLNGHEFMSEEHLINLPQNIVPGLTKQTQGAGDDFDPQVVKSSSSGNYDRYEETPLSVSMRSMDASINKLNNLVDASIMPSNSEARKRMNYDEDTDKLIATELRKLAQAFDKLSKVEEHAYDSDVWYTYGSDDKSVKKRPAEWIKDKTKVTIGGTAPTPHAPWNHNFTFTNESLGKDRRRITVVPVTVTVGVNVPEETWLHLYRRHYLPTFAGTVEAVDTFWKEDPHEYITGTEGTELLEQELKLILNKSFNFSKPYNNLSEPPETDDVSWSKAAQKLFFQGNASSELATKGLDGINYNVTVELNSIAPQDPDIAYALLPSQL